MNSEPSLAPGRRFGAYEVLDRLGAGGMGEVYRARDVRLDREVAIKILPSALMADAEYLARFEREARMLAALNHPHVATIYDIEEIDGVRAIVLELVEGPTLAERIGRGPVPIDEAIVIAGQVAAALGAAHQKGIAHRDLKPANVKLTATGAVKVLDFGLAKQTGRGDAPADMEALTAIATPSDATRAGVIVGTTAYMSPEQARGRPIDIRTDIWAFGCLLFELLTGSRAFARETTTDTLAAILEREPAWDRLPAATPPVVRGLLKRCLEKDVTRRLADIGEARAELENIAGTGRAGSGWWWAAAAAILIGISGGAFLAGRSLLTTPAGSASGIRSVAVLPLANLSAAPREDYFADGMTDELIAALAKIRAWRVISRTSVMPYKATTKGLSQIAGELGVDALVEGTVQQADGRIKISVRLISARGAEESLWEQGYDRELRDVLDLQAEVARAIAREISLTLTPVEEERLAARRPVDPEAFQLYLKGKAEADLGTEDAILRGVAYLEQALKADPTYASGHAAMALAYSRLTPAYRAPKDVLPKAREYAVRAIELDASSSEAHTSLAGVMFYFDWDWAGAEREVRRAIDLNPSSAEAHELYGNYLVAMGQHERAVAELQVARALNPSSLVTHSSLLAAFVAARQYDRAIDESRRAIAANPDFAFAHAWLGMALMMNGQITDAIPALERARQLDDNVTTTHFLAIAHAAAGNRTAAQGIVSALALAADSRYSCAYEIGSVFAKLGDHDEAFEWLDRGFEEQCDCMVWLKTEPWIDEIRVDPRYADLVRRARFPE